MSRRPTTRDLTDWDQAYSAKFNDASVATGLNNVLNRISLPKWEAARAAVLAGTGRARVLYIGTSKACGAGAGTGAQLMDGASPKSVPDMLAGVLSAGGLRASRDSWMGSKGLTNVTAVEAYYGASRLSIPTKTNWGSAVTNSLGGSPLQNASDTTRIIFAPTSTTDTYISFRVRSTNPKTLNYGVNGGAAISTVDASGDPSAIVQDAPVVAALSQNTWEMWRTAGAGTFLGGIAYNSAIPAVDVINAGFYGSTTAAHVGGGLNADATIAAVAPNLTIIGLQTNDIGGGVAVVDFTTRMQTLITAAKATGDVILVVESFTALGGNYSTTRQRAFRQATIDLAIANGCRVWDFSGLLVNYDIANADGKFADGLHETWKGYAPQATMGGHDLLAA